MQTGYFQTQDDAQIYYEIHGEGRPLVLLHGWQCSHRFWQRNVEALAERYQVITPDFRGHGNSSKGIHGITLRRYARDIHDLLAFLEVEDAVLMGWALGGPTVLSYYDQFGADRLKGLGLIDITPFPFSGAPWNSQGLHGHNLDGFNAQINAMTKDREAFYNGFAANLFHKGNRPGGTEWIVEECMKLPLWISVAIYSDYLFSDYTPVLERIKLPTLVLGADSAVFPRGIEQGRHIASLVEDSTFVDFPDSGHILFYEEPEKFNDAVTAFMERCFT